MAVTIKDLIVIIVPPEYYKAYKIVPPIIFSYIIFSFHYHLNIGIFIKKKTKYLAIINGSNAVLNLSLNYILISKFGIWGAVWSTFICFVYKMT